MGRNSTASCMSGICAMKKMTSRGVARHAASLMACTMVRAWATTPVVELPLLFVKKLDAAGLEQLAQPLAAA